MGLFKKDKSADTTVKQGPWSKDDEKYFFDRYSQSGYDNPEYLINQAYGLYLQNTLKDNKVDDSIIRLLDTYVSDFPNDKTFKALAYYIYSQIYQQHGDIDRAFEFLKKAADAEMAYPEWLGGAGLDYAEHVVKHGMTEQLGEAEKYIGLYYKDNPDTPTRTYHVNTILAAIAESRGDIEKQRYYKKRAEAALNEIANVDKKLRYVKIIKVKDVNEKLRGMIIRFMLDNDFEFVECNGTFLWQKKYMACFHNVILEAVFDTIFVVASMLSHMGETGLDGFVSIIAKRPLKKIIDDFERTFKDC